VSPKISGTERWVLDHPSDTPPRGAQAARRWRARRGIGGTPWQIEMRKRYDAAMAEKRAAALKNSTTETT
jgi:hypothetical protein